MVMPGTLAVSHRLAPHVYRLRCVSITPLARPVVPPVYMTAASSSPPISISGPSAPDSSVPKSTTRESAGGAPPLPATTMCFSARRPSAAASTVPSSSSVVTINAASESVRMCRNSTAGVRNTTGVTTAPARQTALYVINTSGQLAMRTTQRSPRCTPSSIRPPVARRARVTSSEERSVRPSKTSASWSPSRANDSSARCARL